jgi:hypothetical protein
VHTIDYIQQKEGKVTYIKQEDGFVINGRMQMFIGKSSASGSQSNFLYIYDQGSSHNMKTTGNNQVRILRNVEFGTLKNYKLLKLSNAPDLDAIYDFMPYKSGLVVSIRTQETPLLVSLIYCQVDTKFKNLDCGPKIRYTIVTKGYIGIQNEEEFFQINIESNQINIAKLEGDFQDENWNHDIYRYFSHAELFDSENYWIRGFTSNGFTGVINWAQLGNVDFGSTYLAWGVDESWKVEGESASVVEEVFVSSEVK